MPGLILSAPASGSGKTTVTLGLLRALRNRGLSIHSFKSGPDYIDPAFHAAATGRPCLNLDAWAMTPDQMPALPDAPFLIEGAMGLFDGAPPDGKGATADLARLFGLPVVLVIDCASMAHSIAAVVRGFSEMDPQVGVAGVILNKVGSERHDRMLRAALSTHMPGLPVLGTLYRSGSLARPSRHLGLVQAGEMPDLEHFIASAAKEVAKSIDINALLQILKAPKKLTPAEPSKRQRSIAIARDAAFSFIYPHHITHWQAEGATLSFFSPLADDPVPKADLIYLPGGYPELHAARIARNTNFIQSLRKASQSSDIYGECGGYMVLGETLSDADGTPHKMAGLLGLHSSFADRKLHLGYRTVRAAPGGPDLAAHEFHYASTLRAEGAPLWRALDAEGTDLGATGLREGRVSGSFAHLINPF